MKSVSVKRFSTHDLFSLKSLTTRLAGPPTMTPTKHSIPRGGQMLNKLSEKGTPVYGGTASTLTHPLTYQSAHLPPSTSPLFQGKPLISGRVGSRSIPHMSQNIFYACELADTDTIAQLQRYKYRYRETIYVVPSDTGQIDFHYIRKRGRG